MFNGYTDDIVHDMSVLVIDKYLYDNGFPITDNDISYDSEYETFYDALIQMDGEIDYDEGDETDSTVVVYRNGCLKRYIGLALKYGSINGLPNGNNFWITARRLNTAAKTEYRRIKTIGFTDLKAV